MARQHKVWPAPRPIKLVGAQDSKYWRIPCVIKNISTVHLMECQDIQRYFRHNSRTEYSVLRATHEDVVKTHFKKCKHCLRDDA